MLRGRLTLPLLLLGNAVFSGLLVHRALSLREEWGVYQMRVAVAERLRRQPAPASGTPAAGTPAAADGEDGR